MRSEEGIFRICFRGIYSCHWKHPRKGRRRCPCCWFSFISLMAILALGWMYVCFVAYNDHSDFNWKAYQTLHLWVNWYMIVIILSAVLAIYCLLLLLFSLFQFAIKEPLDLHWLHKVLLFLGLIIVLLGTAAISSQWKTEWSTVHLSLQATAPFLQLGAVVSLTVISWLVFQSFNSTQRAVSKVLISGAFVAVSTMIFLSPLMIQSPCLTDTLPPKPTLVGHRGAPLLAPENTMMSFRRSMECNVIAFETDVQLSKDSVPFLMHDNKKNFLKRTTNVDTVFPNRTYNTSSDFTWEELQKLNAGDWFLKTDPFWSASSLSDEERARARNEGVPLLRDLLDLAKKHNIAVIFDLKNEDDDCFHIITTILNSSISPDLIWWLPAACREYTKGFRQVYGSVTSMERNNGTFLNVNYSMLNAKNISVLRSKNVTVNLWVVNERWLFSLLWCMGATSVTTNTCHIFKDMSRPDWHLTRRQYLIIWITADLVSLSLMVIMFFLQRRKKSRNQIFRLESERIVPLLSL
ncbi:glycerophosphoinositol inositolphosphodiesterase GDPD2 [Salminus brasiliensis]|uniref:glycerophosphoinositol inositolphosphodiesterase GDPD2 n=1 Tax=Salminus brasiliensis TaxID=930266 RepID=UPI003B835BFA